MSFHQWTAQMVNVYNSASYDDPVAPPLPRAEVTVALFSSLQGRCRPRTSQARSYSARAPLCLAFSLSSLRDRPPSCTPQWSIPFVAECIPCVDGPQFVHLSTDTWAVPGFGSDEGSCSERSRLRLFLYIRGHLLWVSA